MEKQKVPLQFVREEDFVEYYIFTQINSQDDKQQETTLKQLQTEIIQLVENHTKNYLWYKDQFNLSIRTNSSRLLTQLENKESHDPPHLYGVTHFGDCIADEWFIVFLLREITKYMSGTVAKVIDADGEFLLIEAANYLPSWADPDTTENRVYLYNGDIHLVTPQHNKSHNLEVQDALHIIWSTQSTATIANENIQKCIRKKLDVYPSFIMENFHYATVQLPLKITALLNQNPSVISAAVQAFCNRDPIDLKLCKTMKHFPPENTIKTKVKFTKLIYAQLLHSKFIPDRKSGWKLPPPNSKDYKSQMLGMRISCGFEILACNGSAPSNIDDDRHWHEYVKVLKEKGYFKGLLEGSRDYTDLKNKAQDYYLQHKNSMYYQSSIGREILEFLKNVNVDELKNNHNSLPENDDDDDDLWLNLDSSELDSMLEEKYGRENLWKVNENSDAITFTKKIDNFLNHNSDIRGVKVPSDETNAAASTSTTTVNNNSTSIDFDPEGYLNALEGMCSYNIPDDNWNELETDSDDMSEYGDEEQCSATKSINEMKAYMKKMDSELASTTIGQSFEKKSDQTTDIEMNALKNLMESYKFEFGEAGPSSNLLGQIGVHLDIKK